jgi:RimJ/RimL family protein N-acetyltransferase
VKSDADAAYDFICQHYYIGRTQDMRGIVQLRDNKVIGAAVFDNFTTHNCFLHCASDGSKRWLTRWALHEIFKYIFITSGMERCTVWVEADNPASRALVQGLGFTLEAVLHKAGRNGVDVLLYKMFRQECRYA